MRLVFSSARIENAQAVARFLAEEGIEVRIENDRAYRGSIRGNFSYREHARPAPRVEVWVVRSDDQPRARQILRDAGLLESTHSTAPSFLPSTGHAARATPSPRRTRFRLGLLIAATVALALWLNQFRNPGWDLPEPVAARGTAPQASPIDPSLQQIGSGTEAVHRLPVPPALAATLALRAAGSGGQACLEVDGGEAAPATVEAAAAAGLVLLPEAECGPGREILRIAVANYLTDGSGTGAIEVEARRDGAAEARVEQLDVRRDEADWHVLEAPAPGG